MPSGGLGDLPRFEAPCADFDSLNAALQDGPYRLQIWIESPTRPVVGVAYAIPELGAFATNVTALRHLG